MKEQILFRKCFKENNKYYSLNFKFEYPKEGWIEAPDWNPNPTWVGGLSALRPGDDYAFLSGDTWQIFTDYEDLVNLPYAVKVRKAYVISDIDIKKYKKEFLKDPLWAYYYALNIDVKPSKQTRDAACKDPYYAYTYAKFIDVKPSKRTRESAYKDSLWEKQYRQWEEGIK